MSALFEQYLPKGKVIKRWPWWLRWIAPHTDPSQRLIRCSCGRIMWLKSPDKITSHHMGHEMRPCTNANIWQFFRMKTGLINRRTWDEWSADYFDGIQS
jgi:hypothetical protein